MFVSSEIFPADGANFSDYFFSNSTEEEAVFAGIAADIIIILLVFPINSYVIRLIGTGPGNGPAAEFFSLNLAVCEMLYCMECFFDLINYKVGCFWMPIEFLDKLALTCRPLFYCLMCVERYLAVVHPVTFLKYKPLRYRVICSVIVWLTSFVSSRINIMAVFLLLFNLYFIVIMTQFSLYLCIQLFCLVAVLRALKQSGPGERLRERKEENHVKRRAFYIILITTVTMLIIFFPYMILKTLCVHMSNGQVFETSSLYCFISAGLVQPLLFLYRVGKLPSIKCQ